MQIYFLLYNARKRRHGMVKWWDLWFAYSKVGGDWQNLSVCTNFRYFNAICHIFIPSLLPIENRLVHLPCNNNLFLTSWPRDTWHQQDQESDPQHKKTSHRACVGAGVAGIHCRVMMSGSWPRTMSQWSAAPRPAPWEWQCPGTGPIVPRAAWPPLHWPLHLSPAAAGGDKTITRSCSESVMSDEQPTSEGRLAGSVPCCFVTQLSPKCGIQWMWILPFIVSITITTIGWFEAVNQRQWCGR